MTRTQRTCYAVLYGGVWPYLQSVVLGYALHHVGHGGLEDLFEGEGVHHGEDAGKVLQHLLLLLHAHRLAVGHADVRLPVAGNLYLAKRG